MCKNINELQNRLLSGKAINNSFYTAWLNNKFNIEQLNIFLANYFARTTQTALRVYDVVGKLNNPIVLIKNNSYRTAFLKNFRNLCDEIGMNGKPHILLLAQWINNILLKFNSNLYPIEDNYQKLITKETKEFIEIQRSLYQDENVETVIGASYAQEILADAMLKTILSGYLKHYQNLFENEEEFYQTTEYFAYHVFGTELDHSNLIKNVIKEVCTTQASLDLLIASANKFEEITYNFWIGIYNNANLSNNA